MVVGDVIDIPVSIFNNVGVDLSVPITIITNLDILSVTDSTSTTSAVNQSDSTL